MNRTIALLAAFACFMLPLAAHARKEPPAAPPATLLNAANAAAPPPTTVADGKFKKPSRAQRKEQKKALRDAMDMTPALGEIARLKWRETPEGQPEAVRKIDLNGIFHEALQHSIPVRQAEAQIQDTEAQAKSLRDPNLFNLLNIDNATLKSAAESNVLAARVHREAARQKALLDGARLYAALTQAYLGKYLAFQVVEQGKVQLKAEQEHFIAGDSDSFDVTQIQMALVERYNQYLTADNAFHTASLTLGSQLNSPPDKTLVPEGVALQDENASVPPVQLIEDALSLEKVVQTVPNRPDLRELQFRKEALEKLSKAASGVERQKKQAELHQLALEIEKARNAAAVMADKAFADYLLSQKSLNLAEQRFKLASQMLYQLQISHEAGFSSSKDVLDGQIELATVKTARINAQVAHNLSQIQLLYEMGLLNEDVLTRPAVVSPNML